MSENLDLVRSLYAAWERGDYSASEWAQPDIEWVIADGPDPGTWVGLPGMAEGFRSSMGVFRDVQAEVEQYRELDAERVLVLELRRARGKASGLELRRMRSEGPSCSTCATEGSRGSSSIGTVTAPSPISGSRGRRVSQENVEVVRERTDSCAARRASVHRSP